MDTKKDLDMEQLFPKLGSAKDHREQGSSTCQRLGLSMALLGVLSFNHHYNNVMELTSWKLSFPNCITTRKQPSGDSTDLLFICSLGIAASRMFTSYICTSAPDGIIYSVC